MYGVKGLSSEANRVCSVIISKSYGGRSETGHFTNTYEIETALDLDSVEMVTLVDKIRDAEAQILEGNVHFISATVSIAGKLTDAEKDGITRSVTLDLGGTGLLPAHAADTAEPLTVTQLAKWTAIGGRNGRSFYRGCLNEADVNLGLDGNFARNSDLDITGAADNFRTKLGLTTADGVPLGIAMYDKATGRVKRFRPIIAVHFGGIALHKRTRKSKGKTKNLTTAAAVIKAFKDITADAANIVASLARGDLGLDDTEKALVVAAGAAAVAALTTAETVASTAIVVAAV